MEEKDKNNYEITFWVKEENASPVTDILKKNGCDIVEEKPLQKMQLGYPIRKEKYAFLGTVIFAAYSEAAQAIHDPLNLEGSVLRYTLGNTDKRRVEKGMGESMRGSFSSLRERSNCSSSFKRKEESVLTNESLEKKIEEILN